MITKQTTNPKIQEHLSLCICGLDRWIQGAEKLALPTPGYYSKGTLTVNIEITPNAGFTHVIFSFKKVIVP